MKNIGAICVLLFVFCMGGMGGIILMERSKMIVHKVREVPPITLTGLSDSYSVGDIVTLSIKSIEYPPNTLYIKYDWKVIDPNIADKNVVMSKDSTTINFGSGAKPGKITVLVNQSVVTGIKDTSGNVKDVDLDTSGMSAFTVNVK